MNMVLEVIKQMNLGKNEYIEVEVDYLGIVIYYCFLAVKKITPTAPDSSPLLINRAPYSQYYRRNHDPCVFIHNSSLNPHLSY